MSTSLILGDFTFQDFEVPEVIGFGGDQRLSIKKQVGGAHVINVMGADPRPIEWTGHVLPYAGRQSALDRALMLFALFSARGLYRGAGQDRSAAGGRGVTAGPFFLDEFWTIIGL